MMSSLLLWAVMCGTGYADDAIWPSISDPIRVNGGSRDAALVVAIGDYTRVSDIAGATANGRDWYRWLTEGRGIATENVMLLVDHEGVRESILSAAEKARSKVESGGTLWFVFIGHGAPSRDGQDGVLVGWDTQQNADSVYARGVTQREVLSILEQGPQSDTVAIIDACFSGRGSTGAALVADLQPMIPTADLYRGRTTVISAGQSDEFAGALPGLARPAFSYLMLGALRGWGDQDEDGAVTVQEATNYSVKVLESLPLGRTQTPSLSSDRPDAILTPGREAGPVLSQLRLSLSSQPESSASGASSVSVGGDDLSETLAALNQLQAEEAAREAARDALRARVESEFSDRIREVQEEAQGFWSQVHTLASQGGDTGEQALEAFITRYESATVTVGDEQRPVNIPELRQARAWMSRYDSGWRGETWTGTSGYEMVWIEAGSFTMGSPESEEHRYNREVQRQVELTSGFYVGTMEVPQRLWTSLMGYNPVSGYGNETYHMQGDEYPVIRVNWCDAVIFANALSQREGLTPVYRLPRGFSSPMSEEDCNTHAGSVAWDQTADGYRLLTEAEWEYAARAGSTTQYAGTDQSRELCRYANILNPTAQAGLELDREPYSCEDGYNALAPVGAYIANDWGLYDMSGNVWEWCWDWNEDYSSDDVVDPIGPSTGTARCLRGGSWIGGPGSPRVANRGWNSPGVGGNVYGIRLARY